MKMPICPSCQKIKLIRSKALTSINDPNSGKEYLACPRCLAKWYMDDPNRPIAIEDDTDKPKKSIWKTLATWGTPHNEPDAFGVLHPMTYVFPPRHEYPSPFLLPSSTPRQSTDIIPDSKSIAHTEPTPPAAGPSEEPAAPAPEPEPEPEPVLLSPVQSKIEPQPSAEQSVHEEQPEQPIPDEQQNLPVDENLNTQGITPQEILQLLSEPRQPSRVPTPESAPQPGELLHTPSSISDMNSEEQARFELLSRIANSPIPPFLDSHRSDHDDPCDQTSIQSENKQHSESNQTAPQPLSPEEQHLYDTLVKVVATPAPLDPIVYSHPASPQAVLQELTNSDCFREERENADRALRTAERIQQAIQNSPFLPHSGYQSPRSENKWGDSPKFTQPKSPASTKPPGSIRSALRSSRHSVTHSVPPTPRSSHKTHREDSASMPRSPCLDDQPPLPGAFPTPKSAPLTAESPARLSRQSSHRAPSVRSRASLPVAPATHVPIASPQMSRRGSILTSPGRSPLFN